MSTNSKAPSESAADSRRRIVESVLIVLAIFVLGLVIARTFVVDDGVFARFDATMLMFIGVAAALIILKDVKSLNIGDFKVEFRELEKRVEQATATAETAQRQAASASATAEIAQVNAIGSGGKPARGQVAEAAEDDEAPHPAALGGEIAHGPVPGDPWKGVFGGPVDATTGRVLTAAVSPIESSPDLYAVELTVAPRAGAPPLGRFVRFFLHPTFRNPRPIVQVGPDGTAHLRLTAWGAFTAGALADGGKTRLEIDLAELEGAPLEFKNR